VRNKKSVKKPPEAIEESKKKSSKRVTGERIEAITPRKAKSKNQVGRNRSNLDNLQRGHRSGEGEINLDGWKKKGERKKAAPDRSQKSNGPRRRATRAEESSILNGRVVGGVQDLG